MSVTLWKNTFDYSCYHPHQATEQQKAMIVKNMANLNLKGMAGRERKIGLPKKTAQMVFPGDSIE